MLGSAVSVASSSPAPVLPSPGNKGWKEQGYSGDRPESPAVSPLSRKRTDQAEKLGAAAPARHCWSRVPFFTKWINHLCADDPGWIPVEEGNFFEDLKTGLVLCKVVERLVPGVDLTTKGIYQKPRTRATCVANIDKALSVAWRTGVNATNMCSADDIYDGKVTAATRCVTEIFEALQMRVREVRTRSREMLISMNARLSPIGCALSKATLTGDSEALVDDFGDCTKIMALLVSAGKASVEDLLSLAHREQTGRLQGADLDAVLEENGRILSQVLEANECPILLAEKEFARPPAPSPDTLLLQLHFIWRVALGTAASPSPDLAASLASASGSSTWAVSGKANGDDLQMWMQLLSTKFSSLQEAYWSWCGNMSGRMSQSSFMRHTKDLQFQGDAKLIWDTLTRGVPGFLSVEEFARPELEACFVKAAEANLYGDEERLEAYAEGEEVVAAEEGEEEEPAIDAVEQIEDAAVLEPVVLETLMDFATGPQEMATLELITDACRKLQDDKEPRFPSGVEERARLLHEDLQRQQELLASGAASTARLVAAAASAASAAASLSLATPTLDVGQVRLTPEVPDISRLLEGLEMGIGACTTLEEAIEPINQLLSEFAPDDLPAPTTSVDANVLMSDASELRVSLQTNVIARPKDAEEVPVLILEVWAFEGASEEALTENQLLAQVDCSQIVDVLQHGPLTGDLMFEILLKPGADFLQVDPRSLAIANNASGFGERHGPSELRHRSWLVDTRQQPSLFTSEELEPLDALPSGLLLSMKCSFSRAPAWTKLEAARFFDELRILARFVQPQLQDAHVEDQKGP